MPGNATRVESSRLKRILAHHADSRDTLVRFRREAETAASLDHPNILPIYEVSEGEDGIPFFSMKFAAGGSLLENQVALRDETRKAMRSFGEGRARSANTPIVAESFIAI